ncbi:MAG TPA: nuclear transport factor 2 family protein [Tepidisphaeraceae bacterium]|nr:nuclear transport factor 2 family protein [Tepidisphaeraceae bacterium]
MNERSEHDMDQSGLTSPQRRDLLLAGAGLAAALLARPADALAQEAEPAGSDGKKDRAGNSKTGQELLDLSKEKWRWMSERKVDALEPLFHEEAVFVHMGGTMTRAQELDVIKSGKIHYKKADIQEASVRVIGTTAIVLNRIRLLAVVGGNEVTNPFVVTEVYVRQGDAWKLAALSFTRLLGQ